MKYVKIEWIDSGMHVDKGWASIEKYKEKMTDRTPIVTVGILMDEDEESVMVGLSYDPSHDAWYGAQWVLKANITKREYL